MCCPPPPFPPPQGIRTPIPIAEMKTIMPEIYQELHDTVKSLEVRGRGRRG